ncbi:MAG: class I SAM-dependent methyltransferase [Veillonellaceae bacterium]|nr:class I SAM-dependent methyltransferase [Veillonellaceae bacterium]
MITAWTTADRPTRELREAAQAAAAAQGLAYYERGRYSLAKLSEQHGVAIWLVAGRNGVEAVRGAARYRFQLNMAELRIREWERSGTDIPANLVAEFAPQRILDCTFGKGSDAAVLAYTLPAAQVTGLECSPALYAVNAWGLQHFRHPRNDRITAALRRIRLLPEEAGAYLQRCASAEFDVVCLDFMFRSSVRQSTNLDSFRPFASRGELTPELLAAARHVARRAVILKTRPQSPWLREEGITKTVGGKYSRVHYGVWICENE